VFAWGIRLGGIVKYDFDPKDYGHTWATIPFIQDLDDYCMQDVRANVALFESLESHAPAQQAVDLEMGTNAIIKWQERVGIAFDSEAAEKFARQLYEEQITLREGCRNVFPAFYVKDGKPFVPKRDNKTLHYTAGATVQKLKLVEFNPGSANHIVINLTRKYGWEPTEFTDKGHSHRQTSRSNARDRR
jgi:hypothetical protein